MISGYFRHWPPTTRVTMTTARDGALPGATVMDLLLVPDNVTLRIKTVEKVV